MSRNVFVNRTGELALLDRAWSSKRGEFLVLYGRRRVGKSRLLAHFADRGHRHLIYEATSGSTTDNLEDISRQIAAFTGRPLFAEQPLTSWRAVFSALDEIVAERKTLIVLDEFQFIGREVPEIGSLLNRFVEGNSDNANLKLVISGSDVSFFAGSVMGYGATTYGRRTGSHRLQPFRFQPSTEFMPGLTVEDQIRAYATFGGMPYYLVDLTETDSVRQAILEQILMPGAKLRDEPTFLFAQESRIRDADRYRSIVRAVTGGNTAPNEVAQRTGIERSNLNHYLDLLYEMEILAKRFPVTERAAAKNFRLEVTDPFLRFWFSFVGPYESRLIDSGRAERHLDETIMSGLDDFVSSPAFEEICRQWTIDHHPQVAAVGSWWGSVKERTPDGPRNIRREVDVAGVDADGVPIVLGSCKWTGSHHPHAELLKLKRAREILKCPDALLLIFSRTGPDQELAREAASDPLIRIVELAELARPFDVGLS